MGLFDEAFSDMGPDQDFTPAEAFLGVMLSAVASDGHISDDEAQGLNTITSRMKLFQSIDGQKYGRMVDRLLGILKRQEWEALLEKAVGSLPQELHETSFANCCDLVLADEGIEEEEKEFLAKLRNHLGIDRDQAQKIFRVMVIKNRSH